MIRASIKSKEKEDISLLINIDNHPWNYICDCGQASGFSVKEYQNTKAIFISHTHFDHFLGWDQIMRHQMDSKQKVIICGPLNIAKQVQSKLRAYTWNLISEDAITYEIREIVSEDLIKVYSMVPNNWELIEEKTISSKVVYQEDNFTVRYAILDHKTPCIAYRFDEVDSLKINIEKSPYPGGPWVKNLKEAFEQNNPDTEIEIKEEKIRAKDLFHLIEKKVGHSLGVIMDHAADESNHQKISDLFSACDIVYMESFFMAADKELAMQHFHSYTIPSGSILKKIGVKEAVPMHFSRKYNAEEIEELIREFEQAFEE